MHIRCLEQLRPNLCVLAVLTTDGEVTQTLECDLLRMTRTGDDAELVKRDTEALVQIIGDDDVLIGDHTLDSRDNDLMGHVAADLRQRLLHVRRRDSEDEHIRLRYRLVDVRREMDTAHIELCRTEIGGVLAGGDKLIDHLLATDEPVDLTLVLHDDLCQCRRP